ncbi:PQQ-binding-like beta-propeller repeat protein [Telmatocola sphagniphila]|uniref:PQQ-binding-like beta-propeller repeat protein n=1 Tax=Telmatocola sphagniphila TaxID=1123043 RepID=A0A8E6B752_9BACT|nr:PQQ-binding-like beta-propeller repeat protein [Telmatocola sphagniphila]QVL32514.1 PQQ-binding-like beta-propeller repeat protein [Telmatocola sphagniphila]
MRGIVTSLLLLCSGVSLASDPISNWPQWRGPTRDGQVAPSDWPAKISGEALKTVWKVSSLGPSYSGPIVSDKYVFTTSTVDKKDEVVTCYDRGTGKEVWKQTWPGSMSVPFFAARNGSWIRSTPAFDGDALYVGGIQDHLVCLEASSGKIRWQIDCIQDLKAKSPDFGCVCSPLVDETAVYMQAAGGFLKIDKKTGKVLWNVLSDGGGMLGSAFSSPVFAKLAGKEQIVVQTRTALFGVDKQTGQSLWSRPIDSFRGMNILTPTIYGEGVFTSTYGGNTRLVSVQKETDKLGAQDAWGFKYEGNMTTPVIVNDHAYFFGKDRRFICVDLKAGKECWRTDKRFGEYWSLVANKDKILALDMDGKLYLIQANPKEFELLDQTQITKSETWAHLAVCGNELYVRSLDELIKLSWK